MKKIFNTLVIASTLLATTESSVGMEKMENKVPEIFKALIEVTQADKDSINNAMKGKNFNFPTLIKHQNDTKICIYEDIPDPLDDKHILTPGNNLVSSLMSYIESGSNSILNSEELRKKLVQVLYSKEFIHENAGPIIQSAIDFLTNCTSELNKHSVFQEDCSYLFDVINVLYNLCLKISKKESYVAEYNRVNVSYHILVEEKEWLDSLLAILRKLKERDSHENRSLTDFITRCEARSSVLEVTSIIYSEVADKIDACLTENCKDMIGMGVWSDSNFQAKIRNTNEETKEKKQNFDPQELDSLAR